MNDHKERLTILSNQEWSAFYAFPDFTEEQRVDYFVFNQQELELTFLQPNLETQVFCALQLAYFKAKQTFFVFNWQEVVIDTIFVLETLFPDSAFIPKSITKYQYYLQRKAIIELYGFRLWSKDFALEVLSMAHQLAKQDITPRFIANKILAYLADAKIVRPSYRTLQDLVSQAIVAQRNHLYQVIHNALDKESQANLQNLLAKDEGLLGLAALKQDAKNFTFEIMRQERQKLTTLKSTYLIAKQLVPKLDVSQQNVDYYASLVNYYTIYDLRRFNINQAYLYLLCYIFKRYQQVTDNLVEAFCYNIKQLDNKIKDQMDEWCLQQRREESRAKQKLPRASELLLLYLCESFGDDIHFGKVRQHAFSILSQEEIRFTAQQMSKSSSTDVDAKWDITDKQSSLVKKRLRPLALVVDFSSTTPDNPYIEAFDWLKQVFAKGQRLSDQPLEQLPNNTIPKRLRPHFFTFDEQGREKSLRDNRFEFWLYRELKKRLLLGEICLQDSIRHCSFQEGLIPLDQKNTLLQHMNLLWLNQPIEQLLDSKLNELNAQWLRFNNELSQGKLEHLEYDSKKQSWHLRKSKANKAQETLDEQQQAFYTGLPLVEIADVLRFANDNCNFLSVFTPLLPRYSKNAAHEDNLLASILAKAFNLGNMKMSEMSDIPYHTLEITAQQCLRLSTLQSACNMLSNSIASLPIFPYFSFNLETLYGAVDGQKFEIDRPTTKARYSSKYFGKGKGVVAYSLLANHIPLASQLIGAHEHESHFVFDIWYNNTSNVIPDAITGDMHSVNKMNFAIMNWFGAEFRPRFTSVYSGPQKLDILLRWKITSKIQKPWGSNAENITEQPSSQKWH